MQHSGIGEHSQVAGMAVMMVMPARIIPTTIECADFNHRGQAVKLMVPLLLALLVIAGPAWSGETAVSAQRPVHTYSIVARDPATGHLAGVGVAARRIGITARRSGDTCTDC